MPQRRLMQNNITERGHTVSSGQLLETGDPDGLGQGGDIFNRELIKARQEVGGISLSLQETARYLDVAVWMSERKGANQ